MAYRKRTQSIHALKFGLNGPIVVNGKKFNNAMSAMGLSNQEVADVMNYIMNSWSNKSKKILRLKWLWLKVSVLVRYLRVKST
jgi:hypothetical protein